MLLWYQLYIYIIFIRTQFWYKVYEYALCNSMSVIQLICAQEIDNVFGIFMFIFITAHGLKVQYGLCPLFCEFFIYIQMDKYFFAQSDWCSLHLQKKVTVVLSLQKWLISVGKDKIEKRNEVLTLLLGKQIETLLCIPKEHTT